MKPTQKSQNIETLIGKIAGKSRKQTIIVNKCMLCGKNAENFKDALSAREYAISGMCQKCQDGFFK